MAASNRYMNVSVVWTVGNTNTALDGIKSAQVNDGLEKLLESADFDAFHTVGGVTLSSPMITLRSINAFGIYNTVGGAYGTLAVTFRDFYSGATAAGGAKLVTMSQAFLSSRTKDGEYRQLGVQNLTFDCYSTDGATNPIAITAL